jgi:hypothetical protein
MQSIAKFSQLGYYRNVLPWQERKTNTDIGVCVMEDLDDELAKRFNALTTENKQIIIDYLAKVQSAPAVIASAVRTFLEEPA